MYSTIVTAQPATAHHRPRAELLPSSQAMTRPAPNSHASTLAIAASPQDTPAQNPRVGASQIPSSISATAIGSAIPAVSLKTEAGTTAAKTAEGTATEYPQ